MTDKTPKKPNLAWGVDFDAPPPRPKETRSFRNTPPVPRHARNEPEVPVEDFEVDSALEQLDTPPEQLEEPAVTVNVEPDLASIFDSELATSIEPENPVTVEEPVFQEVVVQEVVTEEPDIDVAPVDDFAQLFKNLTPPQDTERVPDFESYPVTPDVQDELVVESSQDFKVEDLFKNNPVDETAVEEVTAGEIEKAPNLADMFDQDVFNEISPMASELPVPAAPEDLETPWVEPVVSSEEDEDWYGSETGGSQQNYDALYGSSNLENLSTWTPEASVAMSRYLQQDEYYTIVEDILALAFSGDPDLQKVIKSLTLTRDPEQDLLQKQRYLEVLEPRLQRNRIYIPSPEDKDPIIDIAYDELLGIGPLGPLWRDDEVTDIMVNGPFHVSVERKGALYKTPVQFRSLKHLQDTARRLSQLVDDRGVSRNNPLVTVQLPSARVQLVWEPLAPSGASLVIRKHRSQLTLDQLLKSGSLTEEMSRFLVDAVESRSAILVSGGTGTGKTTYLNIMSSFIPDSERVIVIEDAAELKLSNTFVEYLLTKEMASADDKVIIGMDKLLRAALRMRPDRIIVGEILDAAGATAMLEAAFTGHDGTMTTIHANNPSDALLRVAGLLRGATGMPEDLARTRVQGTFEIVVQVVRDRRTGKRFVSSISAVNPQDSTGPTTTPLFIGAVDVHTGNVAFEKINGLSSNTPIWHRLHQSGIDTSVWE